MDQLGMVNFARNGLHCTRDGAKYLTVRYSYIDEMSSHGLACEDQNSNISFHSNIIERGGGYGIDTHSDKIEIAGNYIDKKNTGQGMKVPDVENLVVHHNYLVNAASYRGIRTYQDSQTGKPPKNHVYFNNYIRSGSDTSIAASNANPSYLANNDYNDSVSGTKACSGTKDASDVSASSSIPFTMADHVISSGQPIEYDLCDLYKNYATQPTPRVGEPTATPQVTSNPTITNTPTVTNAPTATTIPNTPVPSVTPSNCRLTGDLDCSGVINALDLTIQISQYGQSGVSGDLDNSGKVNALDISMLLQNFGKSIIIFL